MKIVSLLLSLCLVSVALAEDPAELVKLRQIWKKSVAEATKSAEDTYRSKNIKANKLYYAELNEMKKNFMTAQNLNGANAVDAEIKRLEVSHKELKFSPPRKPNKPEQKKASLIDGIWNAGRYLRIFNGDTMLDIDGARYKCTFDGEDVTIYFSSRKGHCEKYTFNPDKPDYMEGVSANGKKVTLERVKW